MLEKYGMSPIIHCRRLRQLVESNGVQSDITSRLLSFYESINCRRKNRMMLFLYINKRELCEIDTQMLQIYFHCNEICKNEGDILKQVCLIKDKRLLLNSILERSGY